MQAEIKMTKKYAFSFIWRRNKALEVPYFGEETWLQEGCFA
jgi:hypothetical protein